jgi:hypothetical protein
MWRYSRNTYSREVPLAVSPDKLMKRAEMHKVLGSGLPSLAPCFLAIALTTSVATAAEAVWPKSSASDLSIFVTILRFRIYADHCSVEVPQLRQKFEILVENLNSRIQAISKELLASDEFKDINDKPVPADISYALKDSFDDVRHNVERLDAASICPNTLQNFVEMDDELLRSGLTANLTAIQNMIHKLEKEGAR